MAYSQASWRKKGLGWIPDLPDVADPTIPTVVGDAIHVQSAADSSAVEETINLLINVLNEKQNIDNADIQKIKIKLLGDTRFPRVKVYTMLRKSSVAYSQINARSKKEIVQLKLALYLIYRKTFNNAESSKANDAIDMFLGDITGEDNLRKELQLKLALYLIYRKTFNDTESGKINDATNMFLGEMTGENNLRKELQVIFEPKNSLALMEWLQHPIFDDSLEAMVIDFQRLAGLIGDGIVGPKTIAAIQANLTDEHIAIDDSQQDSEITEFLCPLTLIPHNVLKEVFQRLTYQWLYEQLKCKVDSVFRYILSTFDFNVSAVEQINHSWHELDEFIREELYAISAIPRDHTAPHKRTESKKLPDTLDRKFTEAFNEFINDFCLRLSSKFQQLVGQHEFTLQDDNEQAIDRFLVFEVLNSQDNCYRISIRSGLDDFQYTELELQELYQTDFIFYKYDVFIAEFKRWFRTVEPFVASILQMLSPLGGFDNYKQAVEASFERLEGCFQLHRLTNRSIATRYNNLITHYSPIHLAEQIEELKFSRETIIYLFQEVASKIDRILEDDFLFRRILLEHVSLDSIESLDEEKLQAKIQEEVRLKNYPFAAEFDEKWKNCILPIASNLHEDIHQKVKNIEKKAERETALKQELARQIKDVEVYISFFKFFESIIKGFLSRYDMMSSQELSGSKESAKDRLASALTSQAMIFEIVPDDLLETFTHSSHTSDTDSGLANSGSATDKTAEIATQLLDPIQLKLPVNLSLLNIASRQKENKVRSYFFLPGVVDLSYWCSPVEDQGRVNACTAFAGIALVEYFAQKRYGKYSNLSARFLYKTARNLMSRLDDEGASVRKTMEALVLFGVPPEDAWPWHEQEFNEEPPAFCYAYAQSYQALKYFRLDTPEIPDRELLLFQIKAVLAAGLPCMFGFTIYSSFFKEKSIRLGHVTFPGVRDQIVGGHAAVAVGYNDYMVIERLDGQPAKPGAILIRNSWGTEWGKGGYGWLPYEYVLEGLTADWWSLLKSEWLDGGAFGIGAVDPGDGNRPTVNEPKNP